MINKISKQINKIDDSFVIDIIIVILAIGIFYILLFPTSRVSTLASPLNDDIQRSLVNPNLITLRQHAVIFKTYRDAKLRDVTFNKNFLSAGSLLIPKLTSFGIAVLSKYAEDSKADYILVAEHLIASLDAILQKFKPQDVINRLKPRWRVTIPLTRMLAMYMYLGEQSSIANICYQRITQFIPKINESMTFTLTGADLARVAIPRLMATYLNARGTFREEVRTDVFKSLDSVFNVTRITTADVEDGIYADGIYADGSAIVRSAANFEDLVSLDFYAKIYDALGRRSNINSLVTSLFNDVLHPELDFLPFGLFTSGSASGTELLTSLKEYKRTATVGTRIFPFIGLGVFKAPKFVFSLRVQRPNIAAFQSEATNYALGLIQMRKMFLNQTYGDNWGWETIKSQPGVMIMKDTKGKIDALKAQGQPVFADEVTSCIGHLGDVRVMFWINKYKLQAIFGKLQVAEYGVVTDNGLVLRYVVTNVTKTVMIQVQDPNVGKEVKLIPDRELHGDSFVFKEGEQGLIQWRQVFDKDREPRKIDVEKGVMSFRFNDDSWKVEDIGKSRFIVRRGTNIEMAGTSSPDVNDKFSYNMKEYLRNPVKLMYYLKK
ncbi:GSCOCT00014152001.2-RA-CDS [Cotesia congregata]|uniref:Cc_odve66_29 n=1 Tax=Cotesia congregata TaxID=51543 RepID=A0A8J2E683_COTCN|nr:GSCOCT00014152001.2-RA-CDS [Cotesia congregata]CAG5074990.1 Cc_odve66_29 [Cotesia congregata]